MSLAAPRLRLNHYRATPKSATESPLSRRIYLTRGPWQETRDQFYCIAIFAHSRRVWMQICFIKVSERQREPNKFASVAWRRVRQLRRSPPQARDVKEKTPKVRVFILRPVWLITLKHEHEYAFRTCASVRSATETETGTFRREQKYVWERRKSVFFSKRFNQNSRSNSPSGKNYKWFT